MDIINVFVGILEEGVVVLVVAVVKRQLQAELTPAVALWQPVSHFGIAITVGEGTILAFSDLWRVLVAVALMEVT